MPNPPTSVGPRSRRKRILAHAVGVKRSVGLFFLGLQAGLTGIVFNEALLTKGVAARLAIAQAMRTERSITTSARVEAPATTAFAAVVTRVRTVKADRRFAGVTDVVLLARETAAIVTGNTLPVLDRDIRRTGVVSPEHLPNENEEVEEASLLQRLANSQMTSPLAESFVVNMRMGHFIIRVGGMRILRHDAIRPVLAEPVPIEHDAEGTQFQSFQIDWLSRDRECSLPQVDCHLIELVLQRSKIIDEIRKRYVGWRLCLPMDRVPALLQFLDELLEVIVESLANNSGSLHPSTGGRLLPRLQRSAGSIPENIRERG